MTEEEWVRSCNSVLMLKQLDGRISARKGRLLACASSRRLLPLFTDGRSRNAIAVAERLAEGLATEEERRRADDAANEVNRRIAWQPDPFHCATFTLYDYDGITHWAAHADNVGVLVDESVCGPHAASEADMAELVRHLFGNPFRPYPLPNFWSQSVVQLADALYNGKDCGFALHNALAEAGHPDLATHFRQEQAHPKGCWALDLILGRV